MPLAVALLLALLSLGAAACGDDQEQEFRDSFAPIDERLDDLGERVGDALQDADLENPDRVAARLDSFARELAALRRGVAGLDPPESVEADLERLHTVMGDAQAALSETAAATRAGEAQEVEAAVRALVARGDRLDSLQERLASVR